MKAARELAEKIVAGRTVRIGDKMSGRLTLTTDEITALIAAEVKGLVELADNAVHSSCECSVCDPLRDELLRWRSA